MSDRQRVISILIPAFNEAQTLPDLYAHLVDVAAQLPRYDFEFLFVNDGSSDATMQIIRNFASTDRRISWVNLSRNFGKEIAMIAGLDHVIGDATIIIDADLQDPPELIPQMVDWWEQGYEDVYARRRSRRSWHKRAGRRGRRA